MDRRGVVVRLQPRRRELRVERAPLRRVAQDGVVRHPGQRHQAADIARHHREVDAAITERPLHLFQRVGQLFRLEKRHAVLEHGKAARRESARDALIKRVAEQHLGWAHRIGPVGDDEVEAAVARLVGQEDERVFDLHLQTRVGERGGVHFAQMAPRQIDHLLVNLDVKDVCDGPVLERFLGDRHVAAADDHDLLHAAMFEHRNMRQHLGITALVACRQLHDVVEHQHASVALGVEDLDVLKPALFLDYWRAFQLDGLRKSRVQFLQETVRHRRRLLRG